MLGVLAAEAQVNAYAAVTAITGDQLALGVHNETYHSFNDGEYVVIIQMQDDVIGSTANDATFGSLGSIANAGGYVIGKIATVVRSGGVPTSITLENAPALAFNFGVNSSVQVVSYRSMGINGYTTTTDITALPWNGSIGGVIAFHVEGTLTLQHDIIANGTGFRGGAPDNAVAGTCDVTTWRSTKTDRYAYKGEGIYRVTNALYAAGKGAILNAGGGGNDHNGGGGGGGNFTGGGLAGPGYNCGGSSAGGIGGIGLSAEISGNRIFMGGGGGGGEGNDAVATTGGNGGGIILIEADTLETLGGCGVRRIAANGVSAANAGNDGGGGGGAGGTIVLDIPYWSLADGCDLTIEANGGNGGSVNHATIHGGGGGGGQGSIRFTRSKPVLNSTVQTLNGTGGCNNNTVPCDNRAGNGSGANNLGVYDNDVSPLPIELIFFKASPREDDVLLVWATASEKGNSAFVIERSADGDVWEAIQQLPGAGYSQHVIGYEARDRSPLNGTSFYRLKQLDSDGSAQWSPVAVVERAVKEGHLPLVPNPASDVVTIILEKDADAVHLVDDLGRLVFSMRDPGSRPQVNIAGLRPGIYMVIAETNGIQRRSRLLKY